ncbi:MULTISPECIES: DUF4350 domain-containing protein [Nocardioides]|uniref:DUF4350 domain-containing protein n=1 Tax=Nocardioides TaxID=1839 RepID=UPI0003310A3F|nr:MULTISPECIES: DUF4350 domain-containing protein [Nocardioides]EON25146.1 secreted protein [Nocardioides sp. CF8]
MRDWFERNRSLLVIGLGTLAALVVAVALSTGPRTAADHDPENPGSRGARALAQVLADEGVEVEIVRSAAALEEQPLGPGTTVVVSSPDNLGRSTADRLLDVAGASTTVVVGAAPGAVEALGVDATTTSGPLDGPQPGACTDTGLGDLSELSIAVDSTASYATTAGCFPGDSGWALASAGDGLVLLGAAGIVENDQVLRADNAAVALRLLGQHPRVVWYVPSLDDLVGDDGVSIRSLLPAWLVPAVWLLGLVVLSVIWWRGRRLGALAVEPLPVTVRSLETTDARGRLYRSASARGHAADVLRRTARDDLSTHLRLPTTATGELVRDVALRLDRPVGEIDALIGDRANPPATDDELIRLATALAELDREVRRT